MTTRGFEAHARHREGVVIIDLSGEVNKFSGATLTAAYGEATEGNSSSVLLNFLDVDYINSTGIAVIVALLAQARTEARRVTAYGLTEHYKEIFEITRLSDFMAIYEDEDNAVAQVPA
ncbi:MAG: STAS domain-containing protein [Actinobacteria bacterium]|nr:STAS domain-containing protein [Actinomycetota bacterium]